MNKSNVTIYISNNSEDQLEVPLIVMIDNDTIFNEPAKFSKNTS